VIRSPRSNRCLHGTFCPGGGFATKRALLVGIDHCEDPGFPGLYGCAISVSTTHRLPRHDSSTSTCRGTVNLRSCERSANHISLIRHTRAGESRRRTGENRLRIAQVDSAASRVLDYAPNELVNLPGYESSAGPQTSTLGGYSAIQTGGSYIKDGVRRAIAQKTVVIPTRGGVYVLQLNADAPYGQIQALMDATEIIDQQTVIRG